MTEQECAVLIEEIWAGRIASQPMLNAQRLAWFNGVKECLVSRAEYKPAPPPSNIIALANYATQLQSAEAGNNKFSVYTTGIGIGGAAWPFI